MLAMFIEMSNLSAGATRAVTPAPVMHLEAVKTDGRTRHGQRSGLNAGQCMPRVPVCVPRCLMGRIRGCLRTRTWLF